MRGGQITMFFAIGLVLLLVVGLIYLVVSLSSEEDAANDRDKNIRDTANIGVLSSFLSSCLDTVVHEQLMTLGETGGVLDFTGYPNALVGSGQTQRRVHFGITRNNDLEGAGAIGPWAYPPPRYPNTGATVEFSTRNPAGQEFAAFQDGYFGDVFFPAVCSKTGMNRPGSTFTCKYYEGNPPGTPGPSIQEVLEEKISQGVRGCADLRAFEEAIGQEVETVEEPEVNITFTLDNVLVTLTYPVILKGSTTTRLETFRKDYRVRYMPIAQFAYDLARAEARDVTFNITGDYTDVASYRPGFVVLKKLNVALSDISSEIQSPHASLVTVLDQHSIIEGQSYAFSFLVEHRLPMLTELTPTEAFDVNEFGKFSDGTMAAADPDETNVHVDVDVDSSGDVILVTATDADNDKDWQEF